MNWKLFLDDERYPVDNRWVIARNVDDAIWYITNYGMPSFISFDHDLGPFKQSGMDNDVNIDNFEFYVHSQNPVGAENIRSLLNKLKEHF